MNLARPLHHRDGSFAGVIVAGLRINAVGNFYQMANIGTHGIIAVVGLERGRAARRASGSNPIDPGSSIADTDMFKAMQADPDSVWVGRSALDGIERVHGFRRVADRDLAVVVAVDQAEAMRATNAWVTARLHASPAASRRCCWRWRPSCCTRSRRARRRERGARARPGRAGRRQQPARSGQGTADDKTAQLEATLAGMSDGVAMVDGALQLVEWNPRFPGLAGIPPQHPAGRPADGGHAAGTGGKPASSATSISRRRWRGAWRSCVSGELRRDTVERTRPDGRVIELRRNRLPDGGFVTLYTDITARKRLGERAARGQRRWPRPRRGRCRASSRSSATRSARRSTPC